MIESYYDNLASRYKLMYQDWEASVLRQAGILDGVIREFFGPMAHRILDAACGIGTQSIGLARLGYAVKGSDISDQEIEQARAEASKRGLKITFNVADMRQLREAYTGLFDLVIACDNAIPHLLNDAEIRRAFEQFYLCTTPEGGCIISVRDYAALARGGKQLYPRATHVVPGGRVVLFDLWEFDGDCYDFTTYIVEDRGKPSALTQVIRGGRYYCVTLETLEKLMQEAGFQEVVILRDRYYQPLLVGKK